MTETDTELGTETAETEAPEVTVRWARPCSITTETAGRWPLSSPRTPDTAASTSSPAATASTSAPASITPANPVTIILASGATVSPGVTYGSVDIYGDRYASGEFPGGEVVTVYTFASQDALQADIDRNVTTPQDGKARIIGHLFDVITSREFDDAGTSILALM